MSIVVAPGSRPHRHPNAPVHAQRRAAVDQISAATRERLGTFAFGRSTRGREACVQPPLRTSATRSAASPRTCPRRPGASTSCA